MMMTSIFPTKIDTNRKPPDTYDNRAQHIDCACWLGVSLLCGSRGEYRRLIQTRGEVGKE